MNARWCCRTLSPVGVPTNAEVYERAGGYATRELAAPGSATHSRFLEIERDGELHHPRVQDFRRTEIGRRRLVGGDDGVVVDQVEHVPADRGARTTEADDLAETHVELVAAIEEVL